MPVSMLVNQDANVILTLDTETTMKNTVGKNKASPFHPDNTIVMIGAHPFPDSLALNYPVISRKMPPSPICFAINGGKPKVLVGQNIKFDLHYLRKADATINNIPIVEYLTKNKIWDTQLAEYILTGQQAKFASLNEMSEQRGLPVKNSLVTDMFARGIGADDIDEDILKDYLATDIMNTEAIALSQMEKAFQKKKLPLIESMMDALLAIEEIEYNGNYIDLQRLKTDQNTIEFTILAFTNAIKTLITVLHPDLNSVIGSINIDSTKQLSAILFGGSITVKVDNPIKLKNGKSRLAKKKQIIRLKPLFSNAGIKRTALGYQVDTEVLDSLEATAKVGDSRDLVRYLKHRKKLVKEITTYYEGLSKLIHQDGLVHPNINMCSTDTGRTSASEPNSQNIPSSEESDVKALFISRWGEEGSILAVDYKQIEVIALAILSLDSQLILDLVDGRDIHTEIGKMYYGSTHSMSKDERRVIKTVVFGLIYGGTAKALAPQANLEVNDVAQIINYFYIRYPSVLAWQNKNIQTVMENRSYTGLKTSGGFPSGTSTLPSLTGRDYIFHEKDIPWAVGKVNFKPTEIKNYPVQGFATGDLVLTMLGILWRKLKSDKLLKDDCLMINLVHDEIVFDCKNSIIVYATSFIKNILEEAPMYMKAIYGINSCNIRTPVSVTIGPNWKEQK